MDKNLAILHVTGLLGNAISQDQISECVDGSAIPDDHGRLPGDPDWQPTYDQWWAAAEAAMLAASLAGDQLTHVTSEGTTMVIAPKDWASTANTWRRRSRIWADTHQGGFTLIEVGQPRTYRPTTDLYRDWGDASWT
ncbi:hypothetical protein FYJ43_04390 [Cutibacterium sp. WCA-380-WT-3A]|uniref:Uncharacterized protein n=1 Tax=Cutibacterium porci TaxID=2605781 RepID=A0A7K0J5T3_9ACTN|nr:hypothetical protein [Cutibacterium porci]MSS45296.1 hypothetical protein [Cutibacterium porci]